MYAILRFKQDWTIQDVLADVVSVLTGEVDKTNLSASCRKEETDIISTVAAGWTLHDQVSADEVVVKAPIVDVPSRFKFVRFFTTGNYIETKFYNSWDEVAHSGVEVNSSMGTLYLAQEASNSKFFEIYISASARHFASTTSYNGLAVDSGSVQYIGEHTRDDVWNKAANDDTSYVAGYISSSIIDATRNDLRSRFYWPSNLDATTGNVVTKPKAFIRIPSGSSESGVSSSDESTSSSGSSLASLGWGSTMLNENKQLGHALQHIGVSSQKYRIRGGDLSYFSKIYPGPMYLGKQNDVANFNGERYRIWTIGSHRMLVKEE